MRLSRPRSVPAPEPPQEFDSLFAGGTLPTFGGSDDDLQLAVGIAFSALVVGDCVGVRLHTATTETGTLIGELYDNAGNQLATASGPTDPGAGDYDILFSPPVALSTSTIYVVSVWHPEGRYSFTLNYWTGGGDFTSASGDLFTTEGGSYGPGRFVYGASPAFPSNNTGSWYGVEPLFLAA